jgi:spore coat polysaccharide biosynthesis protein SpsF
MTFKTDQEHFWAGKFGTEYIQRNQGDTLLASNLAFFAKALHAARRTTSVLEFGANIGMNLKALKLLYPVQEQYGIEINADAAKELAKVIPADHVYHTSILDFAPTTTYDIVLIKGVLIHINPDMLPLVYEKLVAACGKYLLVTQQFQI